MLDEELDALLLEARPAAPDEAAVAAADLASRAAASRAGARGRGWRWRWRWRWRTTLVLPVAAGALALTGAGTVTAYQLSIPPFQGLEAGVQRTTHGVPFTYRTDAGTLASCQAFVEFHDVTARQRQQINAMVTDTKWTGYGQRAYDALPAKKRAVQNAPGPTGDAVLDDLERRALRAAPGTTRQAGDGPTITGGAISCSYPNGAPRDSH